MILQPLIPQTALLGLWGDDTNHDEPIINHFLLIVKVHVYTSREKHRLNITDLLKNIEEIKKTGYCLSSNSEKKVRHQNKCRLTLHKLPIEENQ